MIPIRINSFQLMDHNKKNLLDVFLYQNLDEKFKVHRTWMWIFSQQQYTLFYAKRYFRATFGPQKFSDSHLTLVGAVAIIRRKLCSASWIWTFSKPRSIFTVPTSTMVTTSFILLLLKFTEMLRDCNCANRWWMVALFARIFFQM